jgi:hypothetical protein
VSSKECPCRCVTEMILEVGSKTSCENKTTISALKNRNNHLIIFPREIKQVGSKYRCHNM